MVHRRDKCSLSNCAPHVYWQNLDIASLLWLFPNYQNNIKKLTLLMLLCLVLLLVPSEAVFFVGLIVTTIFNS